MKMQLKPATIGIVVGNRGFFRAHFFDSGRKTILKMLELDWFSRFIVSWCLSQTLELDFVLEAVDEALL